MRYETTHVCSTVDVRGTAAVGSRAALLGCVYSAAVPDSARQCARATPRADCPAAGLCHPERAQCHPGLPYPGRRQFVGPIPAAQAQPPWCSMPEPVTGAAARAAPRLWQAAQHLDPAAGGRGLLGAGSDPLSGEHRDYSPSPQTAGRELAAGQTLDHQPRSALCVKKNSATG